MTTALPLPFDDLQRVIRLYGKPDRDSVSDAQVTEAKPCHRKIEYAAGVVFTFESQQNIRPTYWTLLMVADAHSHQIITPHQAALRLLV